MDKIVSSKMVSRAPLDRSVFARREPPVLKYAGFVTCRADQSFRHPLHNDPDVTELALVREGKEDLLIDGKPYRVGHGDLCIFNQGIWHDERSVPGVALNIIYVNFAGLEIAGLPPGFLIDRKFAPVLALGDWTFEIEQRFLDVERAAGASGPETGTIADHLLAVLLADIVRIMQLPAQPVKDRKRTSAQVAAAKRHIHQNYRHPLTLSELGNVACVDSFHLCRIFRGETGYSPIEYLKRYRMEVAKEYLRTTDDTVAVVAENVGYQSETHFQTVFRRHVGTPPGRYRRNSRGIP